MLFEIVNNPNQDSTLQVIKLISLVERITNLLSDSDGNFIGKYNSTKSDVERWGEWYERKGKFKIGFDRRCYSCFAMNLVVIKESVL